MTTESAGTTTDVTVDQIRELLLKSNRAVERAVVAIYERQTPDEQELGTTFQHNSIGFNAYDGELMSSLARQILRNQYNMAEGHILSAKQMELARKRIMRYARQLVEIAQEKVRARVQAEADRLENEAMERARAAMELRKATVAQIVACLATIADVGIVSETQLSVTVNGTPWIVVIQPVGEESE